MNQIQQLKDRYPYMFAGRNIGISIARGWTDLFIKLCEDIDRALGPDKQGFHWVQVKEKFGSARLYWEMKTGSPPLKIDIISVTGHVTTLVGLDKGKKPSSVSEEIDILVNAASSKTHRLCIVCGERGTVNNDDPYILVLCPEHAEDRRKGRLKPQQIWGEEDA